MSNIDPKFCSNCGKQFTGKSYFCSPQCHPRWQGGERWKPCQYCGKMFTHKIPATFKVQKFCSMDCTKKGQQHFYGADHPRWKGGITDVRHKIRRLPEYKAWRNACFARDNYTCVKCGESPHYKEVNHIVTFADIIYEHQIRTVEQAKACKELWDINNGETLCAPCHYKIKGHCVRNAHLVKHRVNSVNA